jgi:hypothetical protein
MSPRKGRPTRRERKGHQQVNAIVRALSIEAMRLVAAWGTGRNACATQQQGISSGMGAGEAGAGARGHTAGATLGAFVGLVAGDVQFDEGAGGDVEFETAAAAIDQRARGHGEAAFLFDDADGFARGAACGPDVFNYQDALARVQFETATKGHLAGAIAFDEEGANAESASDFVADNDAAESGRNDTSNRVVTENFGQRAAERFGVLGELQHERALDVCAAVTAAREFEVALADGTYLLEEF